MSDALIIPATSRRPQIVIPMASPERVAELVAGFRRELDRREALAARKRAANK